MPETILTGKQKLQQVLVKVKKYENTRLCSKLIPGLPLAASAWQIFLHIFKNYFTLFLFSYRLVVRVCWGDLPSKCFVVFVFWTLLKNILLHVNDSQVREA